MKFVHLCIVIVVSCSVCASGDLEIYPGFNFNDGDTRSRLRRFDHPKYYSKFIRYPFQPVEDYGDSETKDLPDYEPLPNTADKVRQFQEAIDWEKAHLRERNTHGKHHSPQFPFDLSRSFNLEIPVFGESRRYFPENDYGYKIDDNRESYVEKLNFDQIDDSDQLGFDEKNILDRAKPSDVDDSHGSRHEAHRDGGETEKVFNSGRFKDVKIVEDPNDFAYAPPDPRFYRKIDNSGAVTDPPKEKEELPEDAAPPDDHLVVNQRSEQISSENDSDGYRTELVKTPPKNEGIEMVSLKPSMLEVDSAGVYVIAIVAGISAAATVGLIAVGIGWYNLQKHVKNASDVDYPAYGVTGPNKDLSPSGDRRLAQSAQMYHYQHQKQQIIAMERAPPNERNGSVSDAESEEENEEGDYTVYECPGLAPTGEMEVKNPLFQDDPTPAQTPAVKSNAEDKK